MPKVYRAMKKDAVSAKPMVGDAGCCLGVRPGDVEVDATGHVGPGNKRGLSVCATPAAISPSMISKEYRVSYGIAGAKGTYSHRLWRAWEGAFVDGPVAPSLRFAVDKHPHGVIEPGTVMHRDEYQAALSRTVNDWHEVPPQ